MKNPSRRTIPLIFAKVNKNKTNFFEGKGAFSTEQKYVKYRFFGSVTSAHSSNRVVIFQLVFYLQWMQFSQHSEAIPFYHGHSNPIGRAVEIPHISIYMSSLHSTCIQGEPNETSPATVQMKK